MPEVVRAAQLGCPRMSRAQLLAALFNAAPQSIAVGGTSGKSTVTGMVGWIMTAAGRDPTIMNGAVMKNFAGPDAPFASARVGGGNVFVSEVDESDGSIALYNPTVAVLNNISLDHKSLEELHVLFADFLTKSQVAVINADDDESAPFRALDHAICFGFRSDLREQDFRAYDFNDLPDGSRFMVEHEGRSCEVNLQVPGHHNALNALAAMAAASAAGVPVSDAVSALGTFAGLARRFDIVGTSASGITVIDDFGHNPDKVAATLATLKAHPGRVIAFFQPHGYGPLRQMGPELAHVLAGRLGADDVVILCDPVYFGGTVDRSVGSERIVELVNARSDRGNGAPG